MYRLTVTSGAGTFIDVEVDPVAGADPGLARRLAEVCPVDIFRAGDAGVEIVEDNLDECVLCTRAAPPRAITVIKRHGKESF